MSLKTKGVDTGERARVVREFVKGLGMLRGARVESTLEQG